MKKRIGKAVSMLMIIGLMTGCLAGCGSGEQGASKDDKPSRDKVTEQTDLEEDDDLADDRYADEDDNGEEVDDWYVEEDDEYEDEESSSDVCVFPEYQMAKLGDDTAIGESEYAFSFLVKDPWEDSMNREGVPFYSTSFVVLIPYFENGMLKDIIIRDKATGEDISNIDDKTGFHWYQGTLMDDAAFEQQLADGSDAGWLSTYDLPNIITCVYVSVDEINLDDIEIVCEYYDYITDDVACQVLEFNTEIDNFPHSTVESGYTLVKLDGEYYVTDKSTSGGGTSEYSKYNSTDFIRISKPLSSVWPNITAEDVSFGDLKNEDVSIPAGFDLYFEMKYVGSAQVFDVNYGLSFTSEDQKEEATEFRNTVHMKLKTDWGTVLVE